MRKGRIPGPKKLKLLKGDKKTRITDKPLARPLGKMRAPGHLTPGAKKEWRRMLRLLDGMGILGQCDYAILGAYCCTYDMLADSTLDQKTRLTCQRHMLELVKELGLSHNARARMRVVPPKPKGGMAKYIR